MPSTQIAMTALLAAAGLAGAAGANATSYTPVVFMHGINGGPGDFNTLITRLTAAHPGQELHALDVFDDAMSFRPIWRQVPHITDVLRDLTKDFDEYHLACHSQGGIVCRAVIESMADHKVATFVSLAGVQQGVRAIPSSISKYLPEWIQNVTDNDVSSSGGCGDGI